MNKGTRALVVAAVIIVIAAVLAYLLRDGSVFTSPSITALLAKFGYDGARDFGSGGARASSSSEELGD